MLFFSLLVRKAYFSEVNCLETFLFPLVNKLHQELMKCFNIYEIQHSLKVVLRVLHLLPISSATQKDFGSRNASKLIFKMHLDALKIEKRNYF